MPPLVTFALIFSGIGLLLWAVAVALTAWILVHPPRMTDGKAAWVLKRISPADVGLPFEECSFPVRNERGRPLKIAAWWIPHPRARGRCAVLLHGYADAKVGALAWAPLWHSLEFHLLLPDLRGHGESGGSVCTAGCHERHDLTQVLNELRAARPDETRELVLFGASMGGAVAAAAAVDRDDIAAVVLDSPYADFGRAAAAHMAQLGLAGRALSRAALRLARRVIGVDFSALRTDLLVASLKCPVLLIQSGADATVQESDRELLRKAASRDGGAEWTVPDAGHLSALAVDPRGYRDHLEHFLRSRVVAAAASR